MKRICIDTHSGKTLRFDVPKGVNRGMCLAALNALNAGKQAPVGLTFAEASLVDDIIAKVQEENRKSASFESKV